MKTSKMSGEKKNLMAKVGIGVGSGAILGGGLAAVFSHKAHAAEVDAPEEEAVVEKIEPQAAPAHHTEVVNHEVRYVNVVHHVEDGQSVQTPVKPEGQLEVIEYNECYDSEGNHIGDICMVKENGEVNVYMDYDGDGKADMVQRGLSETNPYDPQKFTPIDNSDVAMQTYRNAAPQINKIDIGAELAGDDTAMTGDEQLPDYVNDSDTDEYLASRDMKGENEHSENGGYADPADPGDPGVQPGEMEVGGYAEVYTTAEAELSEGEFVEGGMAEVAGVATPDVNAEVAEVQPPMPVEGEVVSDDIQLAQNTAEAPLPEPEMPQVEIPEPAMAEPEMPDMAMNDFDGGAGLSDPTDFSDPGVDGLA